MKIIKQSHEILFPEFQETTGDNILKLIEKIGRVCYKSEDKITKDSAVRFVTNIIKSGHNSVIEHFNITVKFITDRGVTHELVRHRLASYSQESTRYCNYSNDKFSNEITVILPVWFKDLVTINDLYNPTFILEGDVPNLVNIDTVFLSQFNVWYRSCRNSEEDYLNLVRLGQTPQEARSVLPNSLKTEIVVTANLREWRHILTLRTSPKAHPQIRALMIGLLNDFKLKIPVVFNDIVI